MNNENIEKLIMVYGGIRFCQKYIPESELLSNERKLEILKLLSFQEQSVDKAITLTLKNISKQDSSVYDIFKLCQKEVYSVI